MKQIRNFSIIAHVDHGKSTLADRLLEVTGTLEKKEMRAQVLDDMDLERERGITIKSHAIQMMHEHEGASYILNLIDTPGHVDFSYEVSRSLAACEGALVLVDATQGIEAETIAKIDLVRKHNLASIPILNKIDLPSARIEEISDALVQLLGCQEDDIILASGKSGIGIEEILSAIIDRIPPPAGDASAPLQAMVFDASYDPFRGVKVYFRVFNGTLQHKDYIRFFQAKKNYQVEEIGILKYEPLPQKVLKAGDIGYLTARIREAKEIKIGDTITHRDQPCEVPIKGFEEVAPMVFSTIFPVVNGEYESLKKALEKLQLNDASLIWHPESSQALGFGCRCGFLGMLHMEIIKERLARESNVPIIMTMPSVALRVLDIKGEQHTIRTPAEMIPAAQIKEIQEPIVAVKVLTQASFVGPIMELCMKKRGVFKDQHYLSTTRVVLGFMIPLSEVVFDFFDRLKSISQGYASLEYTPAGFRKADLVKLDLLIHGKRIDALSVIVHREKTYQIGRKMCTNAKEIIPRHMFEVSVQAVIGQKVIARANVKPFRKDMLAGIYGGHRERKDKLLDKQKAGKARMKQIGKVNVPPDLFLKLLKVD
ncbi:MAG: translation elongation factor 4 [Cytophagales bacterium]